MSDPILALLISLVAVLVLTGLLMAWSLVRPTNLPKYRKWRFGVFAEHDIVQEEEEWRPVRPWPRDIPPSDTGQYDTQDLGTKKGPQSAD